MFPKTALKIFAGLEGKSRKAFFELFFGNQVLSLPVCPPFVSITPPDID